MFPDTSPMTVGALIKHLGCCHPNESVWFLLDGFMHSVRWHGQDSHGPVLSPGDQPGGEYEREQSCRKAKAKSNTTIDSGECFL